MSASYAGSVCNSRRGQPSSAPPDFDAASSPAGDGIGQSLAQQGDRLTTAQGRLVDDVDNSLKVNAVQLACLDDRGGWSAGLGPVGVYGSFHVPLGHLAFDQARA